jgi:coenzyme F420-reducing hydrogenase gamma subunit
VESMFHGEVIVNFSYEANWNNIYGNYMSSSCDRNQTKETKKGQTTQQRLLKEGSFCLGSHLLSTVYH